MSDRLEDLPGSLLCWRTARKEHVTTPLALGLVLASGLLHALWNLLAKRASGDVGGPAFVWLYSALSTAIFAPLAVGVVVWGDARLGPLGALFVFGTGVLHIGYFLSLQKGYQVGDLSVVYPLARGVGPLLASGAAILLLGEPAGPLTIGGILLIVVGVFLLAWEPGGRKPAGGPWPGVAFGVLTGVFVAAYTLWDKHAVSGLALSPILYYWGSLLVQTLILLPVALRKREEVSRAWSARRPETLGVAVLSPLAYLLVLTAMVFAPVSRVAPVREVGILMGTILGGSLLAEGGLGRRLLASLCMVVGIVVLALG